MNRLMDLLANVIPNVDFQSCNNLVSGGIIDSLEVVEIIDAIESEYEIELSGDDIDPDNFESATKIMDMIKKYIEIKNVSKIIPEVFATKLSKIKFWIYGNGNNADRAYAELEKYNCTESILGVIVGEDYWYEGLFFHGHEVKKYSLSETYENLLITFDPNIYAASVREFIENENIKNIYIFFSWKMFLTNHWIGFGSKKCHFIDNYYEIAKNRNLDNEYYDANKDEFEQTISWLCDDLSVQTMRCYIDGHTKLKNYPMLGVWKQKDLYDQYFPSFLEFSDKEVVVDCGAFTGDTFESFVFHVGEFGKYYAFEPDMIPFKKLKTVTMFYDNVFAIKKGVSSTIGEIGMDILSGGCSTISDNATEKIQITTIDEEVQDNVSFIKMDIEGAELDALKGAEATIKRCKPKLAICVYHKKEDLIDIPAYIKSLRPDYKFYLRAHVPTLSEVVLYAI